VTNRYDTLSSKEGQFQPDSNDQVLLNKMGITDSSDMDDVELDLLEQLTESILHEVSEDQTITIADLSEWHRRWLGNVYDWAGEYRSVNMGKDGFQFAAAHLIHGLMETFGHDFLSIYTACNEMDDEQLIEALANVHIEYILIHPFREGNGRLSRLLATVMALQAGQPLLDFSYMDVNKEAYFLAVREGLDNVEPMKEIFTQVLHASQQNVGE
jgi:cell filamentation protein